MSVESKEENNCDYNSEMARGLKVIISKLRQDMALQSVKFLPIVQRSDTTGQF